MPCDAQGCRQQPAAGVIIRVGVVILAGNDVLAVQQARRNGDMRRCPRRCKVRLRLGAAAGWR